MMHRLLLGMFLMLLAVPFAMGAQPAQSYSVGSDNSWNWNYSEEGGGSSYLGVTIDDVTADRLAELKLKEEHGAEVTMVDQDAPAGKAGVREQDVIVSLNGTAIDSAAQLRRMIKETPAGRVITLGISRDGQPMTIKVQLADRHKSMAWEPNVNVEIPKIEIPKMDFDLTVSVVVVHQMARSGLMVENLSPQLGDFFGVKDGKGVLVRSVDKGSRGEKAGFRAGDVVVKVNDQPVHDTSDFTHAIRSSSGNTASVTVMRDKREQNLTLTLPAKKDSGSLLEDSFAFPELSAETEQALNRLGDEMACMQPNMLQPNMLQPNMLQPNMEKMQRAFRTRDLDMKAMDRKMRNFQRNMRDRQREMLEQAETAP
ncbi:MAG: PDZ domain-containing protein [Terriglobales bacterium]